MTAAPGPRGAGFRTRAALAAARGVAALSRRTGRGAGEVIGGKVALRLDPQALTQLAANRETVVVSATNGKTTTTRLITAAWESAGPVVSNGGGANMVPGVVSALAASRAPRAVLEVDELHLPRVVAGVNPKVLALLNLSRDQLDRSNETRRIAGLWRELGATLPDTLVVANADDPLVAWAAMGFAQASWVHAGQVWTSDAMVCPRCAALLRREPAGPGGSAPWSCPRCGLTRPAATLGVAGPAHLLRDGEAISLGLALPGRCNIANAAIALAVTRALGLADETAIAGMQTVSSVAGRYSTVSIGGKQARLLLAKNPAGWLEMLELLEETPGRPVIIDFNARTADGRDPSWIWDVPVGRLAGRDVFVSGDRRADVVTRLAYAGVEAAAHPTAAEAVAAASATPAGNAPAVDILATYTAFRDVLLATGRTT